MPFPSAKKARMVLQLSPKSTNPPKEKRQQTNKQKTKLIGMQNLKIQKFNFNAHIHKLISGAAHRD
jgi:hypothetical protein